VESDTGTSQTKGFIFVLCKAFITAFDFEGMPNWERSSEINLKEDKIITIK
jgi:hypothetical protein